MDKNITIETFAPVLKTVMGINNATLLVQEINFEETFHFSKTQLLTEYMHVIQH